MADENRAFENRYVLFFDFLGASEAAKHWPRERVHEFLDLLIWLSQAQAEQEIDGAAMEDGG